MNDYDPTGYYERKHRRNMEFMDKALIPFFKYAGAICLILLAADLALS